MPLIKKILIVAVGFYITLLLSGFLLPPQTIVSRSIVIQASQQRVFSLVSEHRQFKRWSPWAAQDPNMQVEYQGPDVGVGSKQIWHSKHPKVGNGESVYTAYTPYSFVSMDLSFDQGGGEASFSLSAKNTTDTQVVWAFKSTHNNIFERFIGFFLLENMLAPDLESGLASLKVLAESDPILNE